MILQLSSGQGPAECELGVGKLLSSLREEFPDIEIIKEYPSKTGNGYKSVLFSTESDLSFLDGSVLWICESPVRAHHKRKNWYIDVSVIDENNHAFESTVETEISEKDLLFERFHCGGKGGQNVNKVETGVRLTHIPSGITVTSTAERTQELNRKDALNKMKAILHGINQKAEADKKNGAWREHNCLQRGNPVRVYKGIDFKRVVKTD